MFKSKELMSNSSARYDALRRRGLLWLKHSETFPNAFTFCIHLTRNQKASAGYEDLQKEAKNSVEVPPFRARSGWCSDFKDHFGSCCVWGVIPADKNTVKMGPPVLERRKQRIDEEGESLARIFKFDGSSLLQKRMSSRTFSGKGEALAQGEECTGLSARMPDWAQEDSASATFTFLGGLLWILRESWLQSPVGSWWSALSLFFFL